MNGAIRRIKSRGYDVLIWEDYDTARDYITDLFKDCDDGFKDAGFSVPERIKDGEIAIADGYQIIEGYYGGNYSYKNIKKGDELRATNSRQYELITYGEHDDDAIGEILERINNVWDTEYYAVEVVGLEGENLGYLVGVELDDIKGSNLRVIDQIIGYGVEIPEEMLEGLKKTEEEII